MYFCKKNIVFSIYSAISYVEWVMTDGHPRIPPEAGRIN